MSNTVKFRPEWLQAQPQLLAGKRILITGAGSGVGKSLALEAANQGADVFLLGRTQSKLEQVYDQICQQTSTTPFVCPSDLNQLDLAAAERLIAGIEGAPTHHNGLDAIVHNAAILGQRTPLESYREDVWNQVMQTNLNAGFLLTKAALPALKQGGGSLIFTSSGVGRQGRAFWGAYAVSKFAIEGMVQVLHQEVFDTAKVRVNAINPGATQTAMRAAAFPAEDPSTLPTAESRIPAYLWLLSDQSKEFSGNSLDI